MMCIVVNSSPLIFLARLGWLEKALQSFESVYISQGVVNEITAKHDETSLAIKHSIDSQQLHIKQTALDFLAKRLNQRLGKGESEAIALAVELKADRILLDDFAARKEAFRLGLEVKGTLAVIRMLQKQNKVRIDDLDEFYEKLVAIQFRIKRHIVDDIFKIR